jgi:hypothetical protein
MTNTELRLLLRRLREGMRPDPAESRLAESFTGWSWGWEQRSHSSLRGETSGKTPLPESTRSRSGSTDREL